MKKYATRAENSIDNFLEGAEGIDSTVFCLKRLLYLTWLSINMEAINVRLISLALDQHNRCHNGSNKDKQDTMTDMSPFLRPFEPCKCLL